MGHLGYFHLIYQHPFWYCESLSMFSINHHYVYKKLSLNIQIPNIYWTAKILRFSHHVFIVRSNKHNQICYLKFIKWASNSKTGLVISSAIPQQQQKIKTKPCGNIWTYISASCVLLSHLLFLSIKINIKQRIKTVKKFWAGDHWARNWRRADLEKLRIFKLIDPWDSSD